MMMVLQAVTENKSFTVMARWFSATRRAVGQQPIPVLHIPHGSSIFKFATSKLDATRPVFSNLEWTIKQGESWAIVGNASEEKTVLLETLKSHTRVHPPPPRGLWPFLTASDLSVDPTNHIRVVSFSHRPQAQSGHFYDYSARYGAVREQDRVTVQQYLLNSTDSDGSQEITDAALQIAESLELTKFLHLPLVALSNGQMRRARIFRALVQRPKVLILDEPLTGLDVSQRPRLLSLLKSFHETSQPHIIMSIRIQDPIPDWITHIFFIHSQNRFYSGLKQHVIPEIEYLATAQPKQTVTTSTHSSSYHTPGDILIDLQKVNVKYQDRHILENITWTIRQGERWILSGPNGSGKTTLLSLITGDHPQSYTQSPPSSISLFSRQLATPALAQLIGISSPEIYSAFPRRVGNGGLTVFDAIGTGFEGVFTFRRLSDHQKRKVHDLLAELGPGPNTWTSTNSDRTTAGIDAFASRLFATLTPGEQSLVLLLRAVVNEPRLLILDEAFSGMDNDMARTVSKYLRERLSPRQAVVWVSHWEDECPWPSAKRLTLGGKA